MKGQRYLKRISKIDKAYDKKREKVTERLSPLFSKNERFRNTAYVEDKDIYNALKSKVTRYLNKGIVNKEVKDFFKTYGVFEKTSSQIEKDIIFNLKDEYMGLMSLNDRKQDKFKLLAEEEAIELMYELERKGLSNSKKFWWAFFNSPWYSPSYSAYKGDKWVSDLKQSEKGSGAIKWNNKYINMLNDFIPIYEHFYKGKTYKEIQESKTKPSKASIKL